MNRGRRPAVARRVLEEMALDCQRRFIIPHCRHCSRPCCRLTDVVLEFAWPQFAAIYAITQTQREFDHALASGGGPVYVRKQDGIYYTHGEPCPAYDPASAGCRLYHSDLKPENCSDFPIYRDGDTLVMDGRCEAVDVAALLDHLRQTWPRLQFTRLSRVDYGVLHRITVLRRRPPPVS